MNKQPKRMKGVNKGAPSGVLISLSLHAAAFLLAGALVVFSVVNKQEKKFEPPPQVDRPKMKLKKPQVKVKKSAKPKSTQRIVTKMNRAGMPEIQLPEMSGAMDGLIGDVAGFDFEPNLEEISLFGKEQSIGNDLEGTFYDFSRKRNGSRRMVAMEPARFVDEVKNFVASGWNAGRFRDYYKSPNKLYATSVMIPPVKSSMAPYAFNEPETGGWTWLVHYKGELVYPEDITFRFWGHGDDILVVRVNDEVVLAACWPWFSWNRFPIHTIGEPWQSSSSKNFIYYLGNEKARVGDWITLKANEPQEIEIIIGEVPGGEFCSLLTVEVEGVEYERNKQHGPILPMFKTAVPSLELRDAVCANLVEGEASVYGGPIFCDYIDPEFSRTNDYEQAAVDSIFAEDAEEETIKDMPESESESEIRTWTLVDGRVVEAKFIMFWRDSLRLRLLSGKNVDIHISKFSSEDIRYIELKNPPKLDVTFTKFSSVVLQRASPHQPWDVPPRCNEFSFGAKVKQNSGGRDYPHKLQVEYFAFARELLGEHFILVDRGKSSFVPTKKNNRSHVFRNERKFEFLDYVMGESRRGREYAGNLVTVTDERGKIIAYSASNVWMWDNLDKIKMLPIGSYLDKSGMRVRPTSPPSFKY